MELSRLANLVKNCSVVRLQVKGDEVHLRPATDDERQRSNGKPFRCLTLTGVSYHATIEDMHGHILDISAGTEITVSAYERKAIHFDTVS